MTQDNNPGREDPPPLPPEVTGGEPMEPELVLSEGSDSSGGSDAIDLSELDEAWTPYFRYEAAYSDQVDAIDTFLDLLADNGYYVHEGACGTGKTLMAVTAGIHAIRDRSYLSQNRSDEGEFPEYSRVVVTTPLKQQLKQFIEEMRGINQSLDTGVDPVSTVVMRGRTDMLPYAYTDAAPFDRHPVTAKIDDLREMTAELIRFDSNIPLNWPDGMTPPDFSRHDYDWSDPSETAEQHRERYRFDPERAKAVQQIVADLERGGAETADNLIVDGVETPFPDYVPHTNDVVDTAVLERRGTGQLPLDLQGKFDPFYAGFFAGGPSVPFSFDDAEDHVFDRHELIEKAASRGICPHETMAHLASDAEVVLGNYSHLYDPQTRLLTEEKAGILDRETIIVVDEAHQIESRVRDMLSDDMDIYTLDRAIADVEIARHYANGDFEKTPSSGLSTEKRHKAKKVAKEALNTIPGYSVSVKDLSEVERFLRYVKEKILGYGAERIGKEFDDVTWEQAVDYGWNLDDIEHPLTDPEDPDDPDTLMTETVRESDYDAGTYRKVYPVMLGLKFVYEGLEEEGIHDRTPQGVGVGEFFKRWAVEGLVEYHRHVVLEHSPKESVPGEYPDWVSQWTPKLQLFNCIPRRELQGVFSELGGGVLMSATIKPEDVFIEAVGIDEVSYPSEDDEEEKPGERPSEFEQYPLRFPEENRLSLIGDLPKYTNKNRGSPTQDPLEMTEVRQNYARVIKQVASSPGNVLVAMPNYNEAEWAYGLVKADQSSKRLHLDQSSSSQETDRTLEEFFADGDSVIFTSTRGTITEGVDYDGGKLHCVVAVGIPLLPTYQPTIRAIKAAYDDRMEGSGFDTALTVPAVRKVRQAFGRVIRGSEETGVRILLDERYGSSGFYGVNDYLSEQEQREFAMTNPDDVGRALSTFWDETPLSYEHGETAEETGSEETVAAKSLASEEPAQAGGRTGETIDADSYSKIYFGEEAGLSGWVSVSTRVAENEIVPLVYENTVERGDSGEDTIKLNFAKELSASGWTDVKANVVLSEIEPIARDARKPE
jgi:DNA excision repair protein ERCC-2